MGYAQLIQVIIIGSIVCGFTTAAIEVMREEFHRFLTFREMGEEKKASEILDKAIKNLPRKQEEEKLKEGEKDMSSKRGKCNGCGKERALVSGGKCWKCYRDTRKGKKKTKVCHEPAPAAEKARVETTVVLRGGQEEYKIPLSITCDLVVCIRNVQAKQ